MWATARFHAYYPVLRQYGIRHHKLCIFLCINIICNYSYTVVIRHMASKSFYQKCLSRTYRSSDTYTNRSLHNSPFYYDIKSLDSWLSCLICASSIPIILAPRYSSSKSLIFSYIEKSLSLILCKIICPSICPKGTARTAF